MEIKPKKSLGQNFLTDRNVVKKIIEAADLKKDDVILEIGPGKGILTEALAERSEKVIAVEIDGDLVKFLRKKFKNQKKVAIIHGDILEISNFQSIGWQTNFKQLSILNDIIFNKRKYKLIANIPYYITSKIIRLFLEAENIPSPSEMILMTQKEVAERIAAPPGKMSLLSVSVQYYAKPEILFNVSKKSFDPAPDVDSSVIKIIARDTEQTTKEKNEKFFRIARAGFCARRKTLSNNLTNSFHWDKKETEKKLKAAGINPTTRAQELSIKDWKKLAKFI